MKTEIFNAIVETRINKIKNLLEEKAVEYTQNDDRLHNFRVSARRKNTTMEKALDGMMEKHAVAVADMVENPEVITEELIDEKIGDFINYLILLEAVMRERLLDTIKRENLKDLFLDD